jgi:tRNA (cytidine/uridine-2'-O-)-methyltransferase
MPIIEPLPPDFGPDAPARCHVVLVHPEIPQNTGNIARLCAGIGGWLHLVSPFSFSLEDRYLKRAGLDYWPSVRVSVHASLEELEPMLPSDRTWLFTSRARGIYTDVQYPGQGSVLVFGCETRGLPREFVARWAAHAVRLPTTGDIRSHNLGNSAAVACYEVVRQSGWRGQPPAGVELVGPDPEC